ncbi:MAG: excisionase family protein [Aquabacterium sp.]|nr:excisionase family protein [Zoogloea sp.]MCK6431894.1 excisionase family protein [Aquabacterium sp.]
MNTAEARPATRTHRGVTVALGGIQVTPAAVVKIELAEAMFGLTRKAIEGKIHRGDWVEGRQYHRAPDGIWINVRGVERWVVTGRA